MEQSTSETDPGRTLNLDLVVCLLRQHYIEAHVWMTGGGTATIYAGTPRQDENGDKRYPAVAGPGWFEVPAKLDGPLESRHWYAEPRGMTVEFVVGPDDDGESTPTYVSLNATEENVAHLIAQQVENGSLLR
jgi:hypothetical protein